LSASEFTDLRSVDAQSLPVAAVSLSFHSRDLFLHFWIGPKKCTIPSEKKQAFAKTTSSYGD
jgi:hypothetical protein